MKKVLLLFFGLLSATLAFPMAVSAESIKSFNASYNLPKSGVVEVTEDILYDFGTLERHGIYRYLPYEYTLDNGKKAYINISEISVTNDSGGQYQYEKYKENGNIVLKIGDPDQTVTGTHLYRITYKAKGAIRYFEEGDEFYWNVNGTGWSVGVERISAKVYFPDGTGAESIRHTCYRGAYSSTDNCQQSDVSGSVATFYDSGLGAAEGLTIVASAPSGTFDKVDAGFMGTGLSDSIMAFLVGLAVAIPALTFVFMLRHWWKHGRDPKGRGTIVAEYSAPDGLTAIEVGTLLDNRVDNKDLSAEIIYLATRGYLKIRREEGKGIFKKDDYTLIRLKDNRGALKPFDNTLLEGVFGSTDTEVKISDLKNEFYTHIQSLKQKVHNALVSDGYFKETVATTIGKYLGIAFLLGFIGYWIAMGLGALTNGLGAYIFGPSLVGSALIVGIFGLLMPARTARGVEAKERILGLKEYMKVAEGDRIKFHNAPKKDPKKFEELLPYAMVLGVEKEWAQQFEGIYKGSPGWYDDPSGRAFMPIVFVNNMNSFATAATTNMTSSPASSSSGSGFGGGGFGGGGFGGGGGGSW